MDTMIDSLGVQHKKYSKIHWDNSDVFDNMRKGGMVEREYEYTNPKKYMCGTVFKIKYNGKPRLAVLTCYGKRWTYTGYSWQTRTGRKKMYVNTSIMYLLNEKGEAHIMDILFQENL